jgi:hypothetical protein
LRRGSASRLTRACDNPVRCQCRIEQVDGPADLNTELPCFRLVQTTPINAGHGQ